jgi:hypothetical protein
MNLCGQKSVNRHGRFRDSDLLRHVFEAAVRACMDAGLVKGEGFAVDASVMEADASRYHGKAPDEIDWSTPERQTRAVAEVLTSTGYLECWHRNQGAIDMATARPNATLIARAVST